MPLPRYPPCNLKSQYYDESSWGYAEPAYEPEYPEYLPEAERPRRDRRRMLVVVAAVTAAVGGGALVAVVLGGSSHPQRTRQVADSRHTSGPAVVETGPDTPSASPSTASPPASPTSATSRAAKPAGTRAGK